MERFGFVGLPNAGKSSLYNALSGGSALAAPYAFATTDPNVGVAKVPDARLDALAEMSNSKNVVPAAVQFVDIGGLVEGASKGEGLGNKFLADIREADAIVYVLRAFADADVPGPSDPLEHLRVLEIELALADLDAVESQIDKRRKAMKGDQSLADEVAALEAALVLLARARRSTAATSAPSTGGAATLVPADQQAGHGHRQRDEDADRRPGRGAGPRAGRAGRRRRGHRHVRAARGRGGPARRRRAGRDARGLGLGEGALPRFVHTAYHLLGLRTFLTTGEKECRAWTFRAGAKAPECGGVIHTDFERGFIRAEVIHWDELLDIGSWSKARDVGKLRVEGKDYEVVDGDVLEFRFNV